MHHYWLIYCPQASRPTWVSTSAEFDDPADALVAYHGAGAAALSAIAVWGHHAREITLAELSPFGFHPAAVLACPHARKKTPK